MGWNLEHKLNERAKQKGIIKLEKTIIQLKKISSFRVLIPFILHSFDSIYDREPPESQFDRSHQATRRSQQTVTFICELSKIFATQRKNQLFEQFNFS